MSSAVGLCVPLQSQLGLGAAGSDAHGLGWDPVLAGGEESWDFPPAAASHPHLAPSLVLDVFPT